MILVGDRNTPWQRGTSIGAEIRLNEGSGFLRESLILTGDVRLEEQYNIELDFEAPDVPTITDVRVTVPAYHTVHTALLFIRHRFYAGSREPADARRIEREPSRIEREPMGEQPHTPQPVATMSNGSARDSGRVESPYLPSREGSRVETTYSSAVNRDRPETTPFGNTPPAPNVLPPWMPRETPREAPPTSPAIDEDPITRPRRRRLE